MTEKDLIKQLKELNDIKPRKDWVLLTKRQILPEESDVRHDVRHSVLDTWGVFHWKLAFAPVISVMIIIGLFGFADNTVPGDFLFPIKKVTENAQVELSTAAEKSGVHLRLANKRLEELSGIAEANKVRSLAPTIKEFQENVNQAINNLSLMNLSSAQELLIETQKMEEQKQEVESVLGVRIGGGTEQFEKQLVAYLITDLDTRTLDEEDQKLLTEAKEAFKAGDYTLALEKLLFLSNK